MLGLHWPVTKSSIFLNSDIYVEKNKVNEQPKTIVSTAGAQLSQLSTTASKSEITNLYLEEVCFGPQFWSPCRLALSPVGLW